MDILASNAVHLLLFASLVFFQIFSKAQNEFIFSHCYNSTNYTSGSEFGTNLNNLFDSLYSKANFSQGLITMVSGQFPDQAYGLVQCRGDLSEDECRYCVKNTSTEIVQRCSNRKQGVIRYNYCVLRYSDRDFFSQLDDEVRLPINQTPNTTDRDASQKELAEFMENWASVAAFNYSSKFVNEDLSNYSRLETLSILLQCNRDLSNDDCYSCLRKMNEYNLPSCCGGSSIAGVFSFSCYLRYDTVPFYVFFPPPPPVLTNASPPSSPPDPPITEASPPSLPDKDDGLSSMQVNIILGSSIAAVVTIFLILTFIYRKKCSLDNLTSLWKKKATNAKNIEIILENYGSIAPQRYRYSAIKKMTDSFKDKLGQGGYGHVYKGRLVDGSLVAVKVLSESKGKGDDFINEVTTIGGTNHLNIVRLLGFCSEHSKRALVYEFMPNGSLEKFIFVDKPKSAHALTWEKLYQIALGIAQGLEYLHRGCNTRILHLDIKPHNILLDENFCPKISDFGLAKLCPTRESAVSMLGARGTIGYIAPEIYYRNIGKVSYKSDVYSYGVMILEMVGGRKNIKADVEHTSEIYFPHWIYDRITQQEDIGLGVFDEVSDEETVRKMILVGLWCIQTDPTDRPSMNKVVEMLQGGIEGINMPSKSFLHSSSN